MAVLKRLTGDTTVTVAGKSRSFTDYGTTKIVPSPSDLTYPILAGRTAVFSDPTDPDSIEITTPPARGKAVARNDGKISFNLNEELATTDIPLSYIRTKDGVPEQVDATITVSENLYKQSGWMKGRHYLPEVDNNDAVVVEPRWNTRFIHISSSVGLTRAQILDRHRGTRDALDDEVNTISDPINQVVIFDTPARDASTVLISPTTYYGETEALAVDEATGGEIHRRNNQNVERPVIVKYKRGEAFTGVPLAVQQPTISGYSALQPNYVTSYGSGALPIFTGTDGDTFSLGTWASNWVWQDLDMVNIELGASNGSNQCFDNVRTKNARIAAEGGSSFWALNFTVRRFVSLDSVDGATTNGGATWTMGQPGRTEGARFNNIQHLFVEKGYISGAGWDFLNGYRPDRSTLAGQAPTTYSHAVYNDTNCGEVYYKDNIYVNCAHSGLQTRSCAIVDNMFLAGHNTGWAPVGVGCMDPTHLGGRGYPTNWVMGHRMVQTLAGWKDSENYAPKTGGGIIVGPNEFSCIDSIIINSTTTPGTQETPYSDITAVTFGAPRPGRTGGGFSLTLGEASPTAASPLAGSFSRDELTVSDWEFDGGAVVGDRQLNGVAQATRRALTIANYADDVMSSSGETLRTFDLDYMRTLAAPWEEIDSLNNYFLTAFGKGRTARTVAQTVTFRPDAEGDTPGQIAIFSRDWHTFDLPGTVSGDSIDLAGHTIYWNMTPANGIVNFDFGDDGYLEMWGGALKPSGAVTVGAGGNTLHMYQGSKFHLPAHSTSNLLTTQLVESRFLMNATVTGQLNFAVIGRSQLVFYEGADVTIQTGRTVEVSGNCEVGFDGSSGGSANLTMANGSTLSFKRGCVLQMIGANVYPARAEIWRTAITGDDPALGDTVTGDTSGAVGEITVTPVQDSGWELRVTPSSGTFEKGEDLTGPGWTGRLVAFLNRSGMRETPGIPKVGEVIEGATSGATAIVGGIRPTGNTDFEIILDNVSGEFQNAEDLLGPTWAGPFFIGDSRNGLGSTPGVGTDDLVEMGTVSGTPTYSLPTVEEFVTGVNGADAPSVASSMTLASGSEVTVDTTGLTPGTYDLIDVDSLVDNGAMLPAGVTVSGNKLMLKV